jgi:hypothetical protein
MEVYCHAGHEDVEHAIWYKIVYRLMDGYKNKNYIITWDNFYFSFTLFWDLLKVGMHAIWTCRIDHKGWPSALTIDPKRESRKQLWYHMHVSSKLVGVSWFGNKPISILSTTFSPINPACATFAIRWHLIGLLEIPTNPILVHY